MFDIQIQSYGPTWAVTQGRTLIAFAVSEETAKALVERLEAHPEDHWPCLVPDWFSPCLFTSVRQYEGITVLAGADYAGRPVCLPIDTRDWDGFERRHPNLSMPFHARIDPSRGELELCWNVWNGQQDIGVRNA